MSREAPRVEKKSPWNQKRLKLKQARGLADSIVPNERKKALVFGDLYTIEIDNCNRQNLIYYVKVGEDKR